MLNAGPQPKLLPAGPSDTSALIYRELEPAEAEQLQHLAATGALLRDGTFRVMGAITPEGEIVATQGIMQMAHWEGFWIAKQFRGQRALKDVLASHVHAMLRTAGLDGAFTIALDNQPAVVRAIESQGGVYVGRLYLIPTHKE